MDDRQKEIIDLLRQGRKLEAIKMFRELTGVDLQQAAQEIEYISAGLTEEEISEPASPAATEIPAEVRRLALEGKKIDAIRVLRNQTGLGLKEAKEQVESIEGVRSGSGCFAVVLFIVGVSLASVYSAGSLG